MSNIEFGYKAGLPIITDDESEVISSNRIYDIERRISYVELAQAYVMANPLIHEIIENAQNTWLDYECPEEQTEDQRAQFLEGISYGYLTVIGIVSAVTYLRSGLSSVYQFFEKMDELVLMPSVTREEVSIVNKNRRANVDNTFDKDSVDFNLRRCFDSEELEHMNVDTITVLDYERYLDDCPNIDYLLELFETDHRIEIESTDRDPEYFSQGFESGVIDCVEMFYLLAQSNFFRSHFDKSFRRTFAKLIK